MGDGVGVEMGEEIAEGRRRGSDGGWGLLTTFADSLLALGPLSHPSPIAVSLFSSLCVSISFYPVFCLGISFSAHVCLSASLSISLCYSLSPRVSLFPFLSLCLFFLFSSLPPSSSSLPPLLTEILVAALL